MDVLNIFQSNIIDNSDNNIRLKYIYNGCFKYISI